MALRLWALSAVLACAGSCPASAALSASPRAWPGRAPIVAALGSALSAVPPPMRLEIGRFLDSPSADPAALRAALGSLPSEGGMEPLDRGPAPELGLAGGPAEAFLARLDDAADSEKPALAGKLAALYEALGFVAQERRSGLREVAAQAARHVRSAREERALLSARRTAAALGQGDEGGAVEPVAPRIPHSRLLHGRRWSDPYHWMAGHWNEPPRPELVRYVDEESRHARRYFRDYDGLQRTLLREFRSRAFDGIELPGQDSFRVREGRRKGVQALFRRTRGGSAWEPALDLADWLGPGVRSATVEGWDSSPDGKKLVVSAAVDGAARVFVYDSSRRRFSELSDPEGIIDSWAWSEDGDSILYARNSLLLNRGKVLLRDLAGERTPAVVFESDEEAAYLEVSRTRDGRFFLIGVNSFSRHDAWALARRGPRGAPFLLFPSREGTFTYADHDGSDFFLRTNDGGDFFDLYTAAGGPGSIAPPVKVLAGSLGGDIEGVAPFTDRVLVTRRVKANPVLEIYDRAFHLLKTVRLPEAHHELQVLPGRSASGEIWIKETSLLRPETLYALDRNGRLRELATTAVPRLRLKDYALEKRFYKSYDGTEVPLTLLYKKSAAPGPRPVYYGAYGAYGASYEIIGEDHAYNLSFALSLLDRGFVVAIGHVRGGGENGLRWMRGGVRENRARSIEDFIRGAEFLIEQGLTEKGQIAIQGYSAGATLVGAALNLRPDLFGAAVLNMGYLDYVNSQLDSDIPSASLERALWGDPRQKRDFDFMARISPYDTIRRQGYPAVLVNSARDDWNVLFHESAKFAAKLRAARFGRSTLLLDVIPPGRGDHAGTYDGHDEDAARALAFVIRELGDARRRSENP